MEFKDLKKFYGTGYEFQRKTGISNVYFYRWRDAAAIPLDYQHLLELKTNGVLKVDFKTSPQYKKFKQLNLLTN